MELHSKVFETQCKAAIKFKRDHTNTIKDFNFKLGDLVLMRNTAIEKALNRKMRPRYLGPLIVISCNRGGAYILAELDGSLFDRPTATFRLIPYFYRSKINLFPLEELLDASHQRLEELRNSTIVDPDDLFDDIEDEVQNSDDDD